ncbi:MAG: YbaK/EbsC family protein [Coriobacteriia bacterium]|nr:YbaK/EbsC family protein [Coriobacteriia bacterium]
MTDRPAPDLQKRGSAERVRDFLASHGLAEEIVHFQQSTKTAQMAADAMGCELGQIVKSLVFVVDATPVLALVAGDRRGDGHAIASETGGEKARFADADTVREATGYAIGGVSPFDLPVGLTVLIDDSLERFDVVYPAAGTPSSMVRMSRDDLARMTGGRVARISH